MNRTVQAGEGLMIIDDEDEEEFLEDYDEEEEEEEEELVEDYEQYEEDDGIEFADPGGRSALRAASSDNPRNLPCPNCGRANRLTRKDRELGYQCDTCADRSEMGWDP